MYQEQTPSSSLAPVQQSLLARAGSLRSSFAKVHSSLSQSLSKAAVAAESLKSELSTAAVNVKYGLQSGTENLRTGVAASATVAKGAAQTMGTSVMGLVSSLRGTKTGQIYAEELGPEADYYEEGDFSSDAIRRRKWSEDDNDSE